MPISGWGRGSITTVVEGGKKYNHEFSVIAPVLGAQARVPILTLKHLVASSFPIDCDALTLTDPFHDSKRVSTMDELKDWLRRQLASDRTMKVVSRPRQVTRS